MKVKYTLICLILFFSLSVLSQTAISLPYFCGFEETAENSNWILNTGPNGATATNKWYISTAVADMGKQSLYISSNGGIDPVYSGTQSRAVVAYREMNLGAGSYDLSFSWRAAGDVNARLYALWMPANITTNTSVTIPPEWLGYALPFPTGNYLTGSSSWQYASTQFTVPSPPQNGGLYKLVFVWTNGVGGNRNIGACIDNIEISVRNAVCVPPSNFDYVKQGSSVLLKGNDITLTWQGTASSYDIQYRIYGSTSIYKISGVVGNTITLQDLGEGLYDFYIRSNCGSETSRWMVLKNVPLYDPDAHCLDYINFTASGVVGTIGKFSTPYLPVGIVDNGPASQFSRQTVHYTPDEFDPRTDFGLRTVPEGEVVSVRLGNWSESPVYPNGEAESLTYTLNVTPDMGFLLLKYAVVSQSGGHNADGQPRFDLKILDGTTNAVLSQDCGTADFRAPQYASDIVPGDGWIQASGLNNNQDVYWRDWTPIGINVQQYQGRTIKIQLTTYDCHQVVHYGYAYFTLSCAEATITSNSCGASQTISVTAPEGFNYEWYKAGSSTILGTDRDFQVETTDSGTYYCDVIYKANPDCKFTLKALLLPRVPVAKATPFYAPQNCNNIVRMLNTSGIMRSDQDTTMLTGEEPDTYYWDFGDGRTSNEKAPNVVFPNEGGTYQVSLKVGIANDECMDSTGFTLVVPPIKDTVVTIYPTICEGKEYIYEGVRYRDPGDYPVYKKTRAGCDSTIIISLSVVDVINVVMYDTICHGEEYIFNGQPWENTGTYSSKKASSGGCDSITTLHLHVYDAVPLSASVQDALTGYNSGSITITSPLPDGYHYELNGEYNAPLTGLTAGIYTITVFDDNGCPSDTLEYIIRTTCLEADVSPVGEICGDDTDFPIHYTLQEGYLTSYSLLFDSVARLAGFEDVLNTPINNDDLNKYASVSIPRLVRPGNYEADLVFHDVNCLDNDLVFTVKFIIYYPSSIIEQKWNDVLAVLNKKYNGGYTFSSFQWYKNGEPIEGATGSYYYLNDGSYFNPNDVYRVDLVRLEDDYSISTCPIIPEFRLEDSSVYPTLVNGGGSVYVTTKNTGGQIRLWDSMGQLRKNLFVEKDSNTTIIMPMQKGIYLVEILLEDQTRKTTYIMVK